MNKTATGKLIVIVISIVLVVASAIHAKQPAKSELQPVAIFSFEIQDPKPVQQKPAAQSAPAATETLQILKGVPRPQIMREMRKINAALGVDCDFCHVPLAFGAETPRKAVARLMMRDYTMALKHKDGSELTCNDCHKGQPNPLRTLPFDGAVGKKIPGRQIFKGAPEERLTQVMSAFNKALGVECTYCHTSDFDEETPRRQIARFMMTQFSQGLVKKDGSAVSCSDCHQGHARPLAVLPFPPKAEQPPAKKPAD